MGVEGVILIKRKFIVLEEEKSVIKESKFEKLEEWALGGESQDHSRNLIGPWNISAGGTIPENLHHDKMVLIREKSHP